MLELHGDALLAEFERPFAAVVASLAFQSSHSEFLSTIAGDIKPTVRVGITMDVVDPGPTLNLQHPSLYSPRLDVAATGRIRNPSGCSEK